MFDKLLAVLLTVTLAVFCFGCQAQTRTVPTADLPEETGLVIFTEEEPDAESAADSLITEAVTELLTELSEEPQDTEAAALPETTEPETVLPDTVLEDEALPDSVEKDGSYTTPEDVAAYIHTFGTLPGNYITKNEAKALGWNSSSGNLWDVAPGKSIGGDRFGNREGRLPKGSYTECDVNYNGGYRGSERLIFEKNGSIYYTNDHYQSFTQLY